jgi:hypothetical protein
MKKPLLFLSTQVRFWKGIALLCLLSYAGFAQQANVTNQAVSPVPMVNGGTPNFTVTQAGSGITNPNDGIDSDLSSTWAVGSGSGPISYKVSDAVNTYLAGNSVGFRADQNGGSFIINLYNNGALIQTSASITTQGIQNHSIVALFDYDEIELVYTRTTGFLFESVIKIYYAINNKSQAGPALPECNIPTALTLPLYPVTVLGGTTPFAIGSGVSSVSAVTTADTSDFATIAGGSGKGYIKVKDEKTDYPAGTFAGFDIENLDFTSNQFGGLSIITYLDGAKQEESGVFNVLLLASSGQSLVANAKPNALGRQTVGFVASKAFDEIEIGYAKNFGGDTKVYSAIVDKRCSGSTPTTLICNTNLDFSYPGFPVSEYSGQAGGCVSTLTGQGALVSADTSDYANFIEGVQVGCVSYVGIKNNRVGDVYPAGTFAGFETAQYGAISISVADLGTVITYLDGVEQERSTTTNLIATSFITGKKRTIGFKTTKDFDEIKYERIGVVGVSLGSTRVYRAVVEKVCPGPALVCNEPTRLIRPAYPMTTYSYMVPYGVVVGCAGSVTGEDALVSADPNDYALLTMVQSLGCLRYVGVKDAAGTLYPSGTYVSAELENMSLITASIGDIQSIVTYKAGVEQERKSKGGLVTATILTGGRQDFGFVTTKDFDEIRYEEFTVITPITLVATRIYGFSVMKLCDGPVLACSTDPNPKPVAAKLNLPGAMNGNQGYPVTLESQANDSFLGVGVCTNQLSDPERVISADTTDFATIASSGVNCWVSLTVTDNKATYPAGSFAGFDILNETAITIDLLGGTYVTTYLDGAVQESQSANGLFADIIGGTGIATSSRRRIGFVTTKPFDAIKFSQGQIIGISLGTTKVYGAVVRKVAADCAAPMALATPPPSALTSTKGTTKTGNAATELAPTGGVAPYKYSSGSGDSLCIAPSGATQITGVTIVDSTGAYSYTTPSTTGSYYFCVKVCDAVSPTPNCAVKVYPITVTEPSTPVSLATPPATALTSPAGSAKTGNAATDLAPSGGTAPYKYSSGSGDSTCVAPSGATQITGVTIVDSTGAYSYTTPSTPGNYYFCVKVCDATSPTPNCAVKVYPITVTAPVASLTLATPPTASLTGAAGSAKSGNAATDLAPSGGTGPYTYSNGSADPACVAPSGATAISGVTVSSTGAYSYTMPTTPGNYYFCVKVCDATSPTPICAVKVYPITVTAANSGSGLTLATPPASEFSSTINVVRTGNAATDLTPSGGTAPYTYSSGTGDPACIAPAGWIPMPGVTISSSGTYGYTTPATPSNYYFCVKVCDSTSPTPICAVKVYTVQVSGTNCVIGSAVPGIK